MVPVCEFNRIKTEVIVDPMFVFTYYCKGIVEHPRRDTCQKKFLDGNISSLEDSSNVAIMRVCEKKTGCS